MALSTCCSSFVACIISDSLLLSSRASARASTRGCLKEPLIDPYKGTPNPPKAPKCRGANADGRIGGRWLRMRAHGLITFGAPKPSKDILTNPGGACIPGFRFANFGRSGFNVLITDSIPALRFGEKHPKMTAVKIDRDWGALTTTSNQLLEWKAQLARPASVGLSLQTPCICTKCGTTAA